MVSLGLFLHRGRSAVPAVVGGNRHGASEPNPARLGMATLMDYALIPCDAAESALLDAPDADPSFLEVWL